MKNRYNRDNMKLGYEGKSVKIVGKGKYIIICITSLCPSFLVSFYPVLLFLLLFSLILMLSLFVVVVLFMLSLCFSLVLLLVLLDAILFRCCCCCLVLVLALVRLSCSASCCSCCSACCLRFSIRQHQNSREDVIEVRIVAGTTEVISLHPHPVTSRHVDGDAGGTRKETVFIFTAEAADDPGVLVEVQEELGCCRGKETGVDRVEA